MTSTSRFILFSMASMLAGSAGLGACHRHGERATSANAGDYDRDHEEGHALTSSVATGETRSASQHIANARCDRERRCSNIGADKKFASDEVCEDSIRSEWANDLNAYECPNGVVQKQLDECLLAIRNEDCSSPFDTLSRIAECRAGQICAE